MLYSRSTGRIIAVDYDQKRMGIAATDILQMVVSNVATIPSGEAVEYPSNYISWESADLLMIGLPEQMNNELSRNMKYAEASMIHLERTIPSVPVTYYGERFTSVLVHKAILEGGSRKKKRQDKGLVSEINAVTILQAYLGSRKCQL